MANEGVESEDLRVQIQRLTRRLEREKTARKAAEAIAEDKTRELYQYNLALRELNDTLEQKVLERTEQLASARDMAEDSNRAKSDFLTSMSHELRTPLNAIIGYSEMLVEDAQDSGDDAALDDLRKIGDAGRHLLALINDLLDLSKIEAGKMVLAVRELELRPMLDGLVAMARPAADANGNTIVLDVPDDLGAMRGDELRIKQVVMNLLSNAAKFTSDGEIRLEALRQATENGEELRVRVTDQGIGMTREQLGRLFGLFAQAERNTAHKYGGSGLGLAISRRLCRMMGGDISVDSAPGKGSSFEVVLPIRDDAPASSAEPDPR